MTRPNPERSQPADLAAAEETMQDELDVDASQTASNNRRARRAQGRRQKNTNRAAVAGGVVTLLAGAGAAVELGGQALDQQAHEVMKSRTPITKGIETNQAAHTAGEVATGEITPEEAPAPEVTGSVELDSPTPEDQTVVITPEDSTAEPAPETQTGGLAVEDTPETGGIDASVSDAG